MPLMERVTFVVNCEIEFSGKLDAYKRYMVRFKIKINDNSKRLDPLNDEAEALLKERTRRGHSIITFHVKEGCRAKYPCPSSYYPEENVFQWRFAKFRDTERLEDILGLNTMLTNKVGTFRYPKTHLAITPTRIGDVELRYMIFRGNSLFEQIKAHCLKLTAEQIKLPIC